MGGRLLAFPAVRLWASQGMHRSGEPCGWHLPSLCALEVPPGCQDGHLRDILGLEMTWTAGIVNGRGSTPGTSALRDCSLRVVCLAVKLAALKMCSQQCKTGVALSTL